MNPSQNQPVPKAFRFVSQRFLYFVQAWRNESDHKRGAVADFTVEISAESAADAEQTAQNHFPYRCAVIIAD